MLDGSLWAPGCPGGLHVSPVGSLVFCNWRTGLTIFEVGGGAAPDARGAWGIVNGIPCWGSHGFPLEYELLEDRSQAGVSFVVPTGQARCWCGQEGGQNALAWPLLQPRLYLCCPGLTTGLPGWPLSGWLKEGKAWSCSHGSHPGCRLSQTSNSCLPVTWWCYSRKEGLEFDGICWDFEDPKPIHLFLPVNRLSNDNLEVHT